MADLPPLSRYAAWFGELSLALPLHHDDDGSKSSAWKKYFCSPTFLDALAEKVGSPSYHTVQHSFEADVNSSPVNRIRGNLSVVNACRAAFEGFPQISARALALGSEKELDAFLSFFKAMHDSQVQADLSSENTQNDNVYISRQDLLFLQQAVRDMERENTFLRMRIEEVETQISSPSSSSFDSGTAPSNSNFKEHLEIAIEENESLQEHLSELKSKLDQAESANRRIENDNQRLRAQFDENDALRISHESELQSLQNEYNGCKIDLRTKIDAFESLQSQLVQLQTQAQARQIPRHDAVSMMSDSSTQTLTETASYVQIESIGTQDDYEGTGGDSVCNCKRKCMLHDNDSDENRVLPSSSNTDVLQSESANHSHSYKYAKDSNEKIKILPLGIDMTDIRVPPLRESKSNSEIRAIEIEKRMSDFVDRMSSIVLRSTIGLSGLVTIAIMWISNKE